MVANLKGLSPGQYGWYRRAGALKCRGSLQSSCCARCCITFLHFKMILICVNGGFTSNSTQGPLLGASYLLPQTGSWSLNSLLRHPLCQPLLSLGTPLLTFETKKWSHCEAGRTDTILISYSVFVVEGAQEMLTTVVIIIGYEPWISYLNSLVLCPYL